MIINLLKRLFQATCYFCGKPATEYGSYYEAHYYSGGSVWRQVAICEGCAAHDRHCHYCTLAHGAYNCEKEEKESK